MRTRRAQSAAQTEALITQSREAIATLEHLVAALEGTIKQCFDEELKPATTKKWWPSPGGRFEP